MKHLYILLFVFFSFSSFAQVKISGLVTDQKGNPLPGANVYIEGTYDGASTNAEGKFDFETFETGEQILSIKFLGFVDKLLTDDVGNMSGLQIKLRESMKSLDVVTITAGSYEAGDEARTTVLKPLDVVTTPGALGDLVSALQTLPATQKVAEDGRLFVRGGDASEALTYIDGMRVFNPYNSSVPNIPTRSRFSPFLFKGISFSTGGYSAEYGQALSSVLSLKSINFPDQDKMDIGLMSVGGSLSASKLWENDGLTVTGDYFNLGPYLEATPQRFEWDKNPESANFQALYRHQFKNKGMFKFYGNISGSGFGVTQDNPVYTEPIAFDLKDRNSFGNATLSQPIGKKTIMTAGVTANLFQKFMDINQDEVDETNAAGHAKIKFKTEFSDRLTVVYGTETWGNQYEQDYKDEFNNTFTQDVDNQYGAGFAEFQAYLSKKVAINPGIRSSVRFGQDVQITPRLSMAYKPFESSQFSAAFGTFIQDAGDLQLTYEEDLKPQKSTHYILSYQYKKNNRVLMLEGYYKDYSDLVTYQENTDFRNGQFSNLKNDGSGFATGIDMFWRDQKTFKNLEYWVSYSYIDTERMYKDFPSKVTPSFVADHSLSVVGKYWWGDVRSQVGLSYTLNTGRPYNDPNELDFMNKKTNTVHNVSANWAYLYSEQVILYASVSNVFGFDQVYGYEFSNTPNENGRYVSSPLKPNADRFFFLGLFITISKDRTSNQLDTL